MVESSSPLKLGFIGGAIDSAVGYAHYCACRIDDRWELTSGNFRRNPEINHNTANRYGIPGNKIYNTWQEFIEGEKNGGVDAVSIITPTPAHYDIVCGCLEAGIPVICEKAMVGTCEQAYNLKKLVEKHKSFLAVSYNYSGYPIIRELKHMISSGALGRLLHFQAEMPQEGYLKIDRNGNPITPQQWRLIDNEIPTLHLDLAVHLHQLIQFLTEAEPVEVVANQQSYGSFHDVIDNVHCLCNYDNNFSGQLWISKSAIGHRNGMRIRIYGEKASAEWYQMEPEQIILCHNTGQREIIDRGCIVDEAGLPRYTRFKAGHPAGYIEAFANLYCDIADCLEDYKNTGKWSSDKVFGVDTALDGLKMLEAMAKSAKSKTWEKI